VTCPICKGAATFARTTRGCPGRKRALAALVTPAPVCNIAGSRSQNREALRKSGSASAARAAALPGCRRAAHRAALPGADSRHRLPLALVGEGGLVRSQDPAHRIARHMQLAADPLQRPSFNMESAPDSSDRIHTDFIPSPPAHQNKGMVADRLIDGGQFWTPIPPSTGINFACRFSLRWRSRRRARTAVRSWCRSLIACRATSLSFLV
jgi:hypothetical protein